MDLDPLGSGFGARDGRVSDLGENSVKKISIHFLNNICGWIRGHSVSYLEGAVKMHMFRKSRALIFLTNVFLNRAGTVVW